MVSVINKIRTFISRFKDKDFRKGISTLIGACFINFFAGAIYSLCTLAVYEISYIKAKGGSIDIEHLSFYYPIEIIFQCFSSIVSGIIYKEMGLHITNLIGITVICLGYFMMYISSSLLFDLISMILGGIGTGIILYPSTTNAYKWFIDHNGIIVGVMETMISFGSFFFAFIGEKIINNDEKPSNEIDNLYDLEIGIKVKDYLIMQIVSLICAFLLSVVLMHVKPDDNEEQIMSDIEKTSNVFKEENKNEGEDKQEKEKKEDNIDNDKDKKNEGVESENKNINEKKEVNNEEIIVDYFSNNKENNNDDLDTNNETLKIDEEKKKEEPKRKNSKKKKKEIDDKDYTISIEDDNDDDDEKNRRPLLSSNADGDEEGEKQINILAVLKFALKSQRLILFSAIVILQAPVSNMAFTLYREIGEYKKIDVKYLQLVGSLYFIFECMSSFVFGILCDYIQLKYLLFFINGVGTFVGFIYCLTFKDGLIFFLVQNFLSFSAGGYYPVKDCYLMKVFGNDIYIELSGYVSFLVAITINLLTPITYLVQSNLEDKEIGYWILFVSFGVLNLIGLILNIFIKETPLDLKEAYSLEEGSKNLSLSLNIFHNSFKNSFHTSFHRV
jgi:MFS family permease